MVWQMVKDGPFGGVWNQLNILQREKMMPSTLITGANRGIGLEFARQYLADNWQVYASYRDPSSASELRRMADGSGGKLQVLSMDVGDLASVKAAALELQGKPIDLLLNNAGIGGPRGQTIGNIDYETWARVLEVNTLGPMRVAEAFVDNVARSERKLIVTITSGMGSIGDNASGGAFAYRSSKAAVNMVMRSLAIDLASRGITCVVMNPGWVQTDMGGPHARLTAAESVAAMRRLIDKLGPAQSGKFFNYDACEYAW
jgi:NAD(P)-dependent dehydrogenase (short-subunit alcohol dehydrogenase family)